MVEGHTTLFRTTVLFSEMKDVEFEYCSNNEEKIHSINELVYMEINH